MALLKKGQYGSKWEFDLGDPSLKVDMAEQLTASDDEVLSAINMENLTAKIFARVLKNRSRAHQALLEKIPAAKD